MFRNKENYHKKFDWFYQSKEYKALRAFVFRRANGLCERCARRGIISTGEEAHHIISIADDWSKRLDPENMILLCHNCHNDKHDRVSALQKFNRIWEDLENGGSPSDNNTE